MDGIVFVQKGYWVNVISTHDVNGYITQPDGSTVNLKIQKGSQHICVNFPAYMNLILLTHVSSLGAHL